MVWFGMVRYGMVWYGMVCIHIPLVVQPGHGQGWSPLQGQHLVLWARAQDRSLHLPHHHHGVPHQGPLQGTSNKYIYIHYRFIW